MDTAIDKNPAGVFCEADEETGGVALVAGLGADDFGDADGAGGDVGVGSAVGGVEAAGEAAHDFEGGVG